MLLEGKGVESFRAADRAFPGAPYAALQTEKRSGMFQDRSLVRPRTLRLRACSCQGSCFGQNRFMLIVHVHVHVKGGFEEAFRNATIENSRESLQEAGIARFDVCQQIDDPTRFVLVEVYRDSGAPGAHKETAHYAKWRDTVAPMMAEPRSSVKFSNIYPADDGW